MAIAFRAGLRCALGSSLIESRDGQHTLRVRRWVGATDQEAGFGRSRRTTAVVLRARANLLEGL